jgi:outer membrane protein assembly factor BamB
MFPVAENRSHGFTLIERKTVIVDRAISVALLFPPVRQTVRAAQWTPYSVANVPGEGSSVRDLFRRCLAVAAGLIAVGLFPAACRAAEPWTSFQNGGHVIVDVSTSMTAKPKWEISLRGYGQSSPIVLNDQIYVTTVEGPNKEMCHVTAYSPADGAKVWQYSLSNATPAESSNYISRAAASPAADSRGVVCLFEGGNLIALTHDGKVRWERNLVTDYGPISARHGLSASVEQSADDMYVWIERSEEPYVICLSKDSGETKWKSPGVGATSWASPRLVPVEGGQHLVLSASGFLVGLDPADGKQLWKMEGISGNSTPTPMPMGDGKFLIGATVGRGESGGGKSAESNGVVQIIRSADGAWSASYLWRAKRATSSFATPIVHNGLALFVNREGVLYGLDVRSGDEIFAKRLSGSSWATALGLSDGALLVPARDGKLDIVADLRGTQTITTLNPLPEGAAGDKSADDAKPSPSDPQSPAQTDGQGAQRSRGADRSGGAGMESGPVLYSAVIAGNALLLRQGDKLYSVPVSSTPGSANGNGANNP